MHYQLGRSESYSNHRSISTLYIDYKLYTLIRVKMKLYQVFGWYNRRSDWKTGFFYQALEKSGLNGKIIQGIKKKKKKTPAARIKINCSLTDNIILEQSIRHGCCLSLTLVTIFIQPLAKAIRQNKDLKGVKGQEGRTSSGFRGARHKPPCVNQSAWDVWLLDRNWSEIFYLPTSTN